MEQIENLDPPTICDNCIHDEICGLEGHLEPALKYCGWKEKRPTGHWIITNRKYELKDKENTFVGTYHKCSECGFDEARGGNFCLNCGAKMEVKNDTMHSM